ncbi:uncharacterized protein UTRI_02783 [Ustilago trichophora]|uniref:Uncharacterized protein n=1 Tax=Ustilago trichophora TaxID=86804 RepID=A0A5C3ER11_9BASI|nr:uncharacterized protein UTRI_02783 [Ustilago trichophora]
MRQTIHRLLLLLLLAALGISRPMEGNDLWRTVLAEVEENRDPWHLFDTEEPHLPQVRETGQAVTSSSQASTGSTLPQGTAEASLDQPGFDTFAHRRASVRTSTSAVPISAPTDPIASPNPLTLAERIALLQDARAHVPSLIPRKRLRSDSDTVVLSHPYQSSDPLLSSGFVSEFAGTKAKLREYKPGFFFLQRPRGVLSLATNEGGIRLVKPSLVKHVFVYKSVPIERPIESPRESILQFIGMLELSTPATRTLASLPQYKISRYFVKAIGPDSIHVSSPLTKVPSATESTSTSS